MFLHKETNLLKWSSNSLYQSLMYQHHHFDINSLVRCQHRACLELPQVSLAPSNTLRWIYSGPLLCPGWAGPAWLILPPVVTIQQRGRHTSQVFLIRPATTADKICCELWNAVLLKQNNYHYFLAAATTKAAFNTRTNIQSPSRLYSRCWFGGIMPS